MQEYDERPDAYDFYFAGGEVHDGAEIGRYMRRDRGQMPSGLTAKGNLRLVLWEPELMRIFRGAPPVQKTVRQMLDEVVRVCTFVETGVVGDEEQPPRLSQAVRARIRAGRLTSKC